MSRQKLGRIVLTTVLVDTGLVSTIVDWNSSHLFNPTWPPHARFHDVAMLNLLNGVCILALWLMWRRSAEPEVGVRVAALIPIIFWGAFFYTTILIPGTSLKATADEFVPSLAGFPLYPNVIVASINVVLSALGYWLYRSGRTSVTNQSEVTNSSESMRG